jgi:hypothetical protein
MLRLLILALTAATTDPRQNSGEQLADRESAVRPFHVAGANND